MVTPAHWCGPPRKISERPVFLVRIETQKEIWRGRAECPVIGHFSFFLRQAAKPGGPKRPPGDLDKLCDRPVYNELLTLLKIAVIPPAILLTAVIAAKAIRLTSSAYSTRSWPSSCTNRFCPNTYSFRTVLFIEILHTGCASAPERKRKGVGELERPQPSVPAAIPVDARVRDDPG